jgi:hypothetical protein
MAKFCGWLVDSPHRLAMWLFCKIIGSFSNVQIQNVGSGGDGRHTYDGCDGMGEGAARFARRILAAQK